jgi:hypothetical protein
MKLFRSTRLLLLAFLLSIVPASSFAGVFINITVAPPVLPVYEQPICPNDGYIWTPGYWAYDNPDVGYYWVPGAWVPAPQPGYLWTPPYWGWEGGIYRFHGGYWGPHIGYYGGVNYGFGYMGWGFAGGEWRGGHFFYNTAIVHVGGGFHNVYVNETIVHNTTIINNNHVSYNGGNGGIRYEPRPEERTAMNEHHLAPTAVQQQHFQAAAHDPQQRFSANQGRPTTLAAARPLTAPVHTQPLPGANHATQAARPATNPTPQAHNASAPASHAAPVQANHPALAPAAHTQAAPAYHPAPAPAAHTQAAPAYHPAPAPQTHTESRPAPASHPAPQSHPASHPSGGEKPHGKGR